MMTVCVCVCVVAAVAPVAPGVNGGVAPVTRGM